MNSDKNCMDEALNNLEKLKEMTLKMKDQREKAEKLLENSHNFSDALQEFINVSGDLRDKNYKAIVLNALIYSIADFLYKYADSPMEGIANIEVAIKSAFDDFYSEDFKKRQEEEGKKSENQQE